MPIAIWFILAMDALLGRKPKTRVGGEQARVASETKALHFYHFAACPFCRKVRRDIRLLGLDIEMSDIKRDTNAHGRLVAGGGKKQVPCLRIEEAGGVRWLYETRDIGAYLHNRFA